MEPVVITKRPKRSAFKGSRDREESATNGGYVRKERGVQWYRLLGFLTALLLAVAVSHAPIQSAPLQIQGKAPGPPSLHCTHRLVTGKRIHLGSAPRACAFDPVHDEMYCGTEGGEIIRVSPEQARVIERWRVTQGKVDTLSQRSPLSLLSRTNETSHLTLSACAESPSFCCDSCRA